MSDVDRDVLPGARRLERIREELGAPIRSSPIGALALVGVEVGAAGHGAVPMMD